MSVRLGVSVQSSAVLAVLLRRGAIVWRGEELRADLSAESVGIALQKLLSRVPHGRWLRWPRIRTAVVLGSAESQVRHLEELPPVGDARTIARIVRENASRFFLRNGRPLLTSNVRLTSGDSAWAAAFEAPVAGAIASACRRKQFGLRAISAAVVALPTVLGDSFSWQDGEICSSVEGENGKISEITRQPAAHAAPSVSAECLPAPLRALGEEAPSYAAAYGAALMPERHPLGLARSEIARLPESKSSRPRLLVAGAFLAIALAWAAFAPGVSAWRAERRAQAVLASVRTEQRSIALTHRELAGANQALEEASALLANRHSALALLGQLTAALPPDAALVTIRTDSTGGHLIALAPRAASVLAATDSVSLLTSVEISGPVTREAAGDRTLERATLHFRWVPNGGDR